MRYLIWLAAYLLVMLGIYTGIYSWADRPISIWEWYVISPAVCILMSYFLLWKRN